MTRSWYWLRDIVVTFWWGSPGESKPQAVIARGSSQDYNVVPKVKPKRALGKVRIISPISMLLVGATMKR